MGNATIVKGLETIKAEDVELYFKLNEQIKELEKTMKATKEKIKNAMVAADIDTLTSGDYVVQITNKTTTKLDEEMLVQVLTAKGIVKDTTEIKVVPVKEKVLLAIQNGQLLQNEYDLCSSKSYSQAITVKVKK